MRAATVRMVRATTARHGPGAVDSAGGVIAAEAGGAGVTVAAELPQPASPTAHNPATAIAPARIPQTVPA